MKHLLRKIKPHYNLKDYKFSLAILVLILSIFGVFMVRSARPDFTNNQIQGVILGFAAMVVISLIDYKWILNLYWPLYVINLVLLAAIWIPGLGVNVNGATRWLNFGFIQFQPSDLTKILMILFFAKFLSGFYARAKILQLPCLISGGERRRWAAMAAPGSKTGAKNRGRKTSSKGGAQ